MVASLGVRNGGGHSRACDHEAQEVRVEKRTRESSTGEDKKKGPTIGMLDTVTISSRSGGEARGHEGEREKAASDARRGANEKLKSRGNSIDKNYGLKKVTCRGTMGGTGSGWTSKPAGSRDHVGWLRQEFAAPTHT